MKRKKNSGGGGANWMDTYGDMVTLLLCFFVLLYSMSTMDEAKWKKVVLSFNPNAAETEIKGGGGDNDQPVDIGDIDQEQIDATLNELYYQMKEYVAQHQAEDVISVNKGEGKVFISFIDTVFFDGDSAVLRPEGKTVLDDVATMLQEASGAIDEVQVLGNTAQGSPDRVNNPTTDRFLASNRATEVLVYLQTKNVVEPARLVSVGYGQWRPVADNQTADGRAQNRRVELSIWGLEALEDDRVTQYYSDRGTANPSAAQMQAAVAAEGAAPSAGDSVTP